MGDFFQASVAAIRLTRIIGKRIFVLDSKLMHAGGQKRDTEKYECKKNQFAIGRDENDVFPRKQTLKMSSFHLTLSPARPGCYQRDNNIQL